MLFNLAYFFSILILEAIKMFPGFHSAIYDKRTRGRATGDDVEPGTVRIQILL